jgi:hypothetical protein
MKPLDKPKALGTRDLNDVLPLLIPLQDFVGEAFESPSDPPMFVYLPHDQKILYYL